MFKNYILNCSLIAVLYLYTGANCLTHPKIEIGLGVGLPLNVIFNFAVVLEDRYYSEVTFGTDIFGYRPYQTYKIGLIFEDAIDPGKVENGLDGLGLGSVMFGIGWLKEKKSRGVLYQIKYLDKFYENGSIGHYLDIYGGFIKDQGKPPKKLPIRYTQPRKGWQFTPLVISLVSYGLYFYGP